MNGPQMSSRLLRVLLVDDNEPLRENLAECLESEGHEVLEAGDGMQALERLDRERSPDVVVLDLLMPGLDGRELAAAVRGRPELRNTRIVLITGASIGELDQLPDVDAVLEKPFGLGELLAEIEKARRAP